jgi:N-acyl-D-aspartate/D-glutamate deacylase
MVPGNGPARRPGAVRPGGAAGHWHWSAMFDLVIVGGDVLDGSGAPAVRADVGVRDGRIAQVGDLARQQARRRIDAAGRTVAPGFIDSHSHDEFSLPVNPLIPGKTLQGVTTQVTGQCGWSPAPILPEHRKMFVENASFLDSGIDYRWDTMADFLAALPPLAINVAQLVGHVAVRCAVMGMEDRPPRPEEQEHMQRLVAESMEGGAFGFSTGLVYPPSAYGKLDEIAALARVAADYGGGYHTHMRNEGQHLFDAVREAAEVGRRSGARVHISHLKISGKNYWGHADELLALLRELRAEGVFLNWDQYPYPAGSSGLKSLLPIWAHEGGTDVLMARLQRPSERDQIRAELLEGMGATGVLKIAAWSDVMIADSPKQPVYNGLNLQEIGEREGKLAVDSMLDMLLLDYAKTLAIFFTIGVEDMERILADPDTTIGSDGIITTVPGQPDPTKPHPRYYGTFPRVLGRYAREQKLLPLPLAVHKMTGLPARQLGLADRGRIAPGLAADLVVFDPATILDRATYKQPQQDPVGIDEVIVNGVSIVSGGKTTGATPGTILRRVQA